MPVKRCSREFVQAGIGKRNEMMILVPPLRKPLLLASAIFCFMGPSTAQTIHISDDELFAVASTSYAIIQSFMVDECAARYGIDHSALQQQFQGRYREFFSQQEAETKRIFRAIGLSYDDFRRWTVKYPSQIVSPSFCTDLSKALKSRTNDVKVVENGIATQRQALKPAFQQ
jgi:hypothetical protein